MQAVFISDTFSGKTTGLAKMGKRESERERESKRRRERERVFFTV